MPAVYRELSPEIPSEVRYSVWIVGLVRFFAAAENFSPPMIYCEQVKLSVPYPTW